MKFEISVFVIHRWNMVSLHDQVISILRNNPYLNVNDNSFTPSNPVKLPEFYDDYACGMISDSDVAIIVPDTDEDSYINNLSHNDYLSAGPHHFGIERSVPHGCGYIRELQTLMFDSCDSIPGLVVGWSNSDVNYVFDLLCFPSGIGNRSYNNERFYKTTFTELENYKSSAKMLQKIVLKHNKLRNRKQGIT